jgi:hypothetical protein
LEKTDHRTDSLTRPSGDQGKCMKKGPFESRDRCRGEGTGRGKNVSAWSIALLCLMLTAFILPGKTLAAEGILTEEELATEKFLSNLEASLAKRFFDYRNRPVIRVAVFDFSDGAGNVVKAGITWADRIARRLYNQPQFEVVSREKIEYYLLWNGPGSLGRLDASALRMWQRRINTLDPGNGIHALITGEVKKGAGRSVRLQVYLTNFQFRIGPNEMEKNLVDVLPLSGEIPVPTEQAVQEANEVVVKGEKQALSEGRLVILANTRGFPLVESEYLAQFSKDQPFPWAKSDWPPGRNVLVTGKEEWTMPKEVRIGLGKIRLSPLENRPDSLKRLEYSFLHGKCGTNEIYFDEMIPVFGYRLLTSFIDLKTNQTYSETAQVQVYPGTTTVVVVSFYVPAEKERMRSQQAPRINIFQFYGKDLEILPKG